MCLREDFNVAPPQSFMYLNAQDGMSITKGGGLYYSEGGSTR